MTTPPIKVAPPWSAAIWIMNRIVCRICGHFHPGGIFGRKDRCACCVGDFNTHGWIGH